MRLSNTSSVSSFLLVLLQVFLVGLLVHFFVHTFVTFRLGVEFSALRVRKEIVILTLICIAGWGFFRYPTVRQLRRAKSWLFLVGVTGLGIFGTLLIHLLTLDLPLTRRALAMRYDYLGFVLLLLGRVLTLFLDDQTVEKLFRRYARVMKRCLVAAIVRRCIVAIKPGTMKLFGYNNYVFEGTVGEQPPAVYYTQINYGLPRNQFLFERPTTFGFRLTAFFPLFYIAFLWRRRGQESRGRWAIYGLNVILTFSRAARGTRLIVVLVTIGVLSSMSRKRLLGRYGLPLLIIFSIALGLGREQIMSRGYSNYGHMTMLQKGWEMLVQKPLFGRGGASVGPGSHRGGLAFNPENQFLQLLIEFGVLGALPRLVLRGRCLRIGLKTRIITQKAPLSGRIDPVTMVLAFSIGMLSLTISGMVLHTFGDRMVVYPFMLLFGCALGRQWRNSLLHTHR